MLSQYNIFMQSWTLENKILFDSHILIIAVLNGEKLDSFPYLMLD